MTVHDRILSVPLHCRRRRRSCMPPGWRKPAAARRRPVPWPLPGLGGAAVLFGRVGADDTGQVIRAELAALWRGYRWVLRCCRCRAVRLVRCRRGHGGRASDPELPRHAACKWSPTWLDEDRIAGCGAVLADMGWPLPVQASCAGDCPSARGIPVRARRRPQPGAGRCGTDRSVRGPRHLLRSGATAPFRPGRAGSTGCARMRQRLPQAGAGRHHRAGRLSAGWTATRCTACRRPSVPVVDTLGAGDVFHGAYALALAEGAALQPGRALRRGCRHAEMHPPRRPGRHPVPARRGRPCMAQPW